jgi:hypothetical protein
LDIAPFGAQRPAVALPPFFSFFAVSDAITWQ